MNNKIFLVAIIVAQFFFSCKNEPKDEVVVESVKPVFKVSLDLVIKQDDSLQIFYCEGGETEINGANTVWSYVKGNDNSQQVVFNLPEDVFPTKLRLDISKNENQNEIEIKGFSVNYSDKTFSIKDTMFYQYFIPNDQIEWDRKKAIAKFKKPNDGESFDPQFGSREIMELELAKLYN